MQPQRHKMPAMYFMAGIFVSLSLLCAGCSQAPTPPPVVPVATTAPIAPTTAMVIATLPAPTPVPTPNDEAIYKTVYEKVLASVGNAAANYEMAAQYSPEPSNDTEANLAMIKIRDAAGQAKYAARKGQDDLGEVSAPPRFRKADSLLRQCLGIYYSSMGTQEDYWARALRGEGVDRSAIEIAGRQIAESNSLYNQAKSEYAKAISKP